MMCNAFRFRDAVKLNLRRCIFMIRHKINTVYKAFQNAIYEIKSV